MFVRPIQIVSLLRSPCTFIHLFSRTSIWLRPGKICAETWKYQSFKTKLWRGCHCSTTHPHHVREYVQIQRILNKRSDRITILIIITSVSHVCIETLMHCHSINAYICRTIVVLNWNQFSCFFENKHKNHTNSNTTKLWPVVFSSRMPWAIMYILCLFSYCLSFFFYLVHHIFFSCWRVFTFYCIQIYKFSTIPTTTFKLALYSTIMLTVMLKL